jgi:hypothetical protein
MLGWWSFEQRCVTRNLKFKLNSWFCHSGFVGRGTCKNQNHVIERFPKFFLVSSAIPPSTTTLIDPFDPLCRARERPPRACNSTPHTPTACMDSPMDSGGLRKAADQLSLVELLQCFAPKLQEFITPREEGMQKASPAFSTCVRLLPRLSGLFDFCVLLACGLQIRW